MISSCSAVGAKAEKAVEAALAPTPPTVSINVLRSRNPQPPARSPTKTFRSDAQSGDLTFQEDALELSAADMPAPSASLAATPVPVSAPAYNDRSTTLELF